MTHRGLFIDLRYCFPWLLNLIFFLLITETILRWVQEPNSPTEAVEGENITLRWDYNLTGDTVFLVQWIDKKSVKNIGRLSSNNPVVFDDYKTRFKINANDKATLIILYVTRNDTGEYGCEVQTQGGKTLNSVIRLDVLCK